MKLTVSNIAWPRADDPAAYALLRDSAVEHIEIAPTRIWPDWQDATDTAVTRFRRELADAGLQSSSLQSLLYGRPELRLLGTAAERRSLVDHLKRVTDIAAAMGAGPMVFGSPANRLRGDMAAGEAFTIARDVFSELAPYCHERQTCLCLEANPPDYGCDFITTGAEAAALVRAVGQPGFGLHLDCACMTLAGDDIAGLITANGDILRHFHASEPKLADFTAPLSRHAVAAAALGEINWNGYVSIEIRPAPEPLSAVAAALRYVRATYGTDE